MDIKAICRPTGRLFFWLLGFIAAASALAATGPQLTIISDVVYRANGQPAVGTIVVSWPAFNTADNKPVAAGELSVNIGAQGTVNFSLAPNEGSEPGGTYYKAVYKLTDGTSYTEYWVVPAASPTTIAAIRATVVPRQVGAQYVNRQYVDTAVATSVHKTGNETVDGAKNFIVSPQVPAPANGASAVNQDYVTAAVSAISEGFVDKGGDTMTGPLLLTTTPTAPQHATNRQYVDEQVADVNAAMVNKLNRLNDTPFTFAGVKYANQFSSQGAPINSQVDAACLDFSGAPGTVMVPSPSDGASLRSQLPDNCHVQDFRRTSAPNEFGTESSAFLKGVVHRFRWTAPNSDLASGSPQINQTFQALAIFADAAKGGINNGTLGATVKSNYRVANFTLNASTPGQHTAVEGKCQKYSAGDCFGVTGFSESWGGSRLGFGDESSVAVSARMIQGNLMFTGTVSAVNGNTLTFSTTTNHQTVGAGTRWLRNLSNDICTSTDGSSPCNGTQASYAAAGTTVTAASGTPWATLANPGERCYSTTTPGGMEYTIPVVSVGGGGSTLTLAFPTSAYISTSPQNYKIHYCSEVAEVVAVDKTNTTPAFATQLSLVSAMRFSAGNLVDLPVSNLWGGEAVKIVLSPTVPTSNATVGLGIGYVGSPDVSLRFADAIAAGGNFRRGIEFYGQTAASEYGMVWNTGPSPSSLFAVFDNADTASIIHTRINRRAAVGGEARFNYANSSDQWTLGSNSANYFCLKTTGAYAGIGVGCVTLAGTALRVVPDVSDNGITINGNTTGHLLAAQVSGVNRFLVNNTQAYFNNALDVKGYSDNATTQKWQITGASGKANFNGGVCQDSAQNLCDLSGAGAPTGVCTTGSTYRRTDGGSATTLYVCESSAWAASGGSGATNWNAIGSPAGNQSLTMGANTTTWTWNAATGSATDLFRLTDSVSNTGTGHLVSLETASSSNLKPLQIKARGGTVLEMNEFGVVTSMPNVTTSAGLSLQVGGSFALKGRDDWSGAVTVNGSDFTGATSTASNTTIRGGDTTSTSGANTGGNLLLRAGGSSSASGTPGNLQVAQTFVKDTTVTSGLLQCFKAAAAMTVGDCGNSALNSVGVAISASNTNPVVVQFQGIATLQFDASASPSAGWFACSSATQGGKVTVQSGACAAGRQVGIVAQNGTSISSGKVFLQAR